MLQPAPFAVTFTVIFCAMCTFETVASLQNILVTGAGGRTGQWVVRELLDDPQFTPTAVVRNERSAKQLRKRIPRLGLDQIVVCDILRLADDDDSISLVPENGVPYHALVICTSSVPVLSKSSFWGAVVRAPWNRLSNGIWMDFRKLQFKWKFNQTPEQIDYHGQVAQINWAKEQGTCGCVVLVGSMGGTKPNNFLNTVGRRRDGTGGDILKWKRQAELYLTKSGMDYVILHPGGLNDDEASSQEGSNYCLGVDDELYGTGRIARRDVARLCVAGLRQYRPGQKVAFDCVTHPSAETRTAETAFEEFVHSGLLYTFDDKLGSSKVFSNPIPPREAG